jgi:hypothetical protein
VPPGMQVNQLRSADIWGEEEYADEDEEEDM